MKLFNLIKNEKEYWLVDQVKMEGKSEEDYIEAFKKILKAYDDEKIGYLSLLMDEAFENWLLKQDLKKISSIVEYTKLLEEEMERESELLFHSLAEGLITDTEFAQAYELCRTGTANKNIPQPIEQVMESISKELGEDWRSHCYYFLKGRKLVGISIPHIEMGTEEEGRMFYFGVVPEMRGMGLGAEIHKITLSIMKNMKATYYVGSTDKSNAHMVQIFKKNGCVLRDKKGIYRIEK
ncbi:GNAT family N-acetyltransferase [Psychrobacillus lasiicapitis]|uniref:GNAT family N-acetyltransferase n=1 Tax=Psychrobacillus lasiicapitis TaxID=1636719 RepID=A0A544TCY1_9BACI|nr:GNAT family N-acetyltransferase [Psychrobacillus lasiicapitis]TQR15249.1 GNAT family N-acetyltransferase [Psychrobacillus lasiicapitis]GGA44140.1 N-acetyltransferase [Psychrobacillus lasiicapitis]